MKENALNVPSVTMELTIWVFILQIIYLEQNVSYLFVNLFVNTSE